MAGLRGMRALQKWAQVRTDGYKDVRVSDMSKSWRSGLAFCAIIHRYRPDLIDFDSLSKENVFENNSLAFEVAQVELGIPALLDAEDMVALEIPDKLSITTYVAQLYNYFKDMIPVGGPDVKAPIKRHSAAPSSPLQSPKRITFDKNSKHQASSDKKSNTLSDRCALCDGKVYLLERQIVDGHAYHRTCWKESNPSPAAQPYGGFPLSPSHRNKKDIAPVFSFDTHPKDHSHSEPPKHTKTESEKKVEENKHKLRLNPGQHNKLYGNNKDTTKTPVGKTKEILKHDEGLQSKYRKTDEKLTDKSASRGLSKTGDHGRKLLFKKDATPDVRSAISMFQDKDKETPGKSVMASPVLRRTENKGVNKKIDLSKRDSDKSDDFDLDSLVVANTEVLSDKHTSHNKPRPVSLDVQKRIGALGKSGGDKKDLTSPGKTMDLFLSNVSKSSTRKEKAQSADLERLMQKRDTPKMGGKLSYLERLERKDQTDSPLKKAEVTPVADSKRDSEAKLQKTKDVEEQDAIKARRFGTPAKQAIVSSKPNLETKKTDSVTPSVTPSKSNKISNKETTEKVLADKEVPQSKDSEDVKKGLYGDRYFEEDWQMKLSAKIRGLSKGVADETAPREEKEEGMDQHESLKEKTVAMEEQEGPESPSTPTSLSSQEEEMEEEEAAVKMTTDKENLRPTPRSATHENISEKLKAEIPTKASSLDQLDKTPLREKKLSGDQKHDHLKSSSVDDLLEARRLRREKLAASSAESIDSLGTPKGPNICVVCQDRVFRSERVLVNGEIFHKKCQSKQPEVKKDAAEETPKKVSEKASRSSSESLSEGKDRRFSEKSCGSSVESLNDTNSVDKGAADNTSVTRRKKEIHSDRSQSDSEKPPSRMVKSEIVLTDSDNSKISPTEYDGEFKRPFPRERLKSADNEKDLKKSEHLTSQNSEDSPYKKTNGKELYIPLRDRNSKDLKNQVKKSPTVENRQEKKYGWRNSKENTGIKIPESPTFALRSQEKVRSTEEKEKVRKSQIGPKDEGIIPEWQLEAKKRQAARSKNFVDPEKRWLNKTPDKSTVGALKTCNKTDVAKKWEREKKVVESKPVVQPKEEYPDELNPFGSTDDEKQLAKEIEARKSTSEEIENEDFSIRTTKVKSYNPFESEDDTPESPQKRSPVAIREKKAESLNPFDTSDEDGDDNGGEMPNWQKEAERRRAARESQSEEDWLRGRSVSSSDSEIKGRGARLGSNVSNGISPETPPPPKPPRSNSGTLEPEYKLDWQKEAEKRQKARGDVYESPSKKVIHPKNDNDRAEEEDISTPGKGLKKVVPDRCFTFDSTSSDRGRSSSTFSESDGGDSARHQAGARKKRLAPQPPKETPPLSPSPGQSPGPSPGRVSSPDNELDLSSTHPRYKKRNAPSRPIAPKRMIRSGERRLSTAEIKQELDVLDKEQTELEVEGRELENKIRGSGSQGEDDDDLLSQWFELVNRKNRMVRRESEIIYISRLQALEDRQADIEYDLRCIMEKQEHVKTSSDRQKEEELLAELVQVVEERSRVVETMEEDRLRAEEEDREIEVVLSEKGFTNDSPEKKDKDKKKKEKKDKKGKKGKKK